MNTPLTISKLRELLVYDAAAGAFTWLRRSEQEFPTLRAACAWNARYAGTRAGCISRQLGYRLIAIHNKHYWEHRLVWMFVTGEMPRDEIDHINGDRADNRMCNLRHVDRKCNAENIRKKSGPLPLGVFFNSRKRAREYSASLRINGRTKHLGYFDTPQEAHDAYVSAKRQHHDGCTL